jgi:hypothetical protein
MIVRIELSNRNVNKTVVNAVMKIVNITLKLSGNIENQEIGLNQLLSFKLPQFTVYNNNPVAISFESSPLIKSAITITEDNRLSFKATSTK